MCEELEELDIITKARDVAVNEELEEPGVITRARNLAGDKELEEFDIITKVRARAKRRSTVFTKAPNVAVG